MSIAAAVGGERHTVALASDGTLFAFGCVTHGKIGKPEILQHAQDMNINLERLNPALVPLEVTSLSPRTLELQDRITCVACGYEHTMAISCNGKLWVWGRNNAGQLGLGDRHAPTF